MSDIEIVVGDPFFFDVAEAEARDEIAVDGRSDVRHLDWSQGKVDDHALTGTCAMSFVPTLVVLREPPRKLLATLDGLNLGVDRLLFQFETADLKGDVISRLEAEGRVHRPGFVGVGEEDRLRRILRKMCEFEELILNDAGLAEVMSRSPRRPKPKGAKWGSSDEVYNLRRLRSELHKVRDLSGGHASLDDVRLAMNDWGRESGAAWELVAALSAGHLENSLRIAPNVSRESVWGFVSLLSSQARIVARVAAIIGKKHPTDAEVMTALAQSTPYIHWESDDTPDPAVSLARVRRILSRRNNLIWRRATNYIDACAWAHEALVSGGNANQATVLELLCVKICSFSD